MTLVDTIDAAALAPPAVSAGLLQVTGRGLGCSLLLSAGLLIRAVKPVRYFPGGRLKAVVIHQRGSPPSATVGGVVQPLVIAAALMCFAGKGSPVEAFSSIPAAMWWSVVALSAVGNGRSRLLPLVVSCSVLAPLRGSGCARLRRECSARDSGRWRSRTAPRRRPEYQRATGRGALNVARPCRAPARTRARTTFPLPLPAVPALVPDPSLPSFRKAAAWQCGR